MLKKTICVLLVQLYVSFGFAQSSIESFSLKLDELAKTKKGLNENSRIDLSGLTLYDFINALAEEHELNVSVDSQLTQLVTSNFYDVNIKDVLLFLIKKHDLEVDVENNILIFDKAPEVVEAPIKETLKEIDVTYNKQNKFLSIKLKNDSLPRVAQAITDITKMNVVLAPNVKEQKVSAYILNRPIGQVLEMMAKSNDLELTRDEDDNFYLKKAAPTQQEKPKPQSSRFKRSSSQKQIPEQLEESGTKIEVDEYGFLNIRALEADAKPLIIEAAEKLKINFFMYKTPEGVQANLVAKGISFDNLLDHLFKGQNYTYKKVDELYLIGEHDAEGLRVSELVQLKNRTIETVLSSMPSAISQSLEIKEFIELNGFVVSGSKARIREFKDYINEIDVVVPVVQIEVIIVQYQKSYNIQTGLQALLDNDGPETSGVLFPTTDVNLSSESVNSLIDAFNGLGVVKLGKVTERFYANLQALENNSIIKLSSTPKLATLSGHEATSSIGETNYYFEQNNRLINSGINNNILQSGVWKSTDANLSINIRPFVSKEENVTLTINVEQSSFLGRAGENAPPGKSTQQFTSMISVRNNEMILLGGLDELENENSGTGTPIISRIPLLRWFFSSRTKRKEKSKLHIFIKPTVSY